MQQWQNELMSLESVVCGGAIGERGDACLSVDGVICETQFRNYGFCIISYFRCFDFLLFVLLVFSTTPNFKMVQALERWSLGMLVC